MSDSRALVVAGPNRGRVVERGREDLRCAVVVASWTHSATTFRVRLRLASGLVVQIATRRAYAEASEVMLRCLDGRWLLEGTGYV